MPTAASEHVALECAQLQAEYWEQEQHGVPMSVHERYRRALDCLRPKVQRIHLPLPLGRLLVQMELVTPDQLERALEEQEAGGKSKLLGEILVDQGALAPQDLYRALQQQLTCK